nr:MAG TPA: hypothetical protein [Caudoviricetes sp.]
MANTKNAKNDTNAKSKKEEVKSVKTNEIEDLKNENKQLKDSIDDLKVKIALLLNNALPKNSDDTEDIEVISMCGQMLNLSTEGYGHGNIYSFNKFGESMPIPKDELKRIILNNRSFAEQGLFYVNDNDFVNTIGFLKVAYKKIINYDTMNSLFSQDPKSFMEMFRGLTNAQKDTFVSLLVDKILNGEQIDMNIVQECGKIIGKDIMKEVNITREIYNK